MENVTYVHNISTQIVTDVTVTDESTGETRNDTTTSEQITWSSTGSIEQTTWSSTGSELTNITGSPQTTIHFTNQTGFTTKSEYYYNNEYDYYNYYDDYSYEDVYMYPGYTFERPFYLYIWEFLVIFTFLVNLAVISVLLHRNMRNSTNVVLTAIAISDSLTGLVTLPSYIMVYLKYIATDIDNEYVQNLNYTSSELFVTNQYEIGGNYSFDESQESQDGCELTKSLCNGFMISKYFLSKTFHSISIFLTLFLGIQRYISIRYPYRSQLLLNLKRTIICCVAIALISPFLHVYHLVEERASGGMCQWELKEEGCGGGCIYLWLTFFIRNLIPCVALVVFTILFILQLRSGERNLRRMDSSKSQMSRRKDENRRITTIVTAIVLVFLIPEIPYGIYLLYNAVDKATNQGKGINLETNRAIHLVYELLLVLSFQANFYIYTFFNRRFRKTLYRIYLKPVRRYFGDTDRLSVSTTSSFSRKTSNRKTETSSAVTRIEMGSMIKTTPPSQRLIKTDSAASSLVGKDSNIFEGDDETVV